jgi:hypothetical protein
MWRHSPLECRAGEEARRVAEKEAARIPWLRLHAAREKYVEWEAFVLWVRAIEEAEGGFPEWLAEFVEKRCRGFLKFVEKHKRDHPESQASFWYNLECWINERIFGKAWREGWMNAVGYYAERDLASEPRSLGILPAPVEALEACCLPFLSGLAESFSALQ